MNILFVYTSQIIPENGGVQRVTSVLKSYFEEQRCEVSCLSLKKETEIDELLFGNHFFLPHSDTLFHPDNITYYLNLLEKKNIDIVINQAALGGTLSKFCALAKKLPGIKLISVIHNSLLGSINNFTSSHKALLDKMPIPYLNGLLNTKLFQKLLMLAYLFKYKRKYRYTVSSSDRIVLLSSNYIEELLEFVPNIDLNKVEIIPNPCTLNNDQKYLNKENELLYVGRINRAQKNVDLLLQIWKELNLIRPDWKLSIVGDGEDKDQLQDMVRDIGIDRVTFYGAQNPIPFYQRSKIFCMTSSFEGFPLVLIESQLYGVVPFAFNSFASVSDIIIDNLTGVLVEPFDIKTYSNKLSELMVNDERTYRLAQNCQKSVMKYSLQTVGGKWIELFNSLN